MLSIIICDIETVLLKTEYFERDDIQYQSYIDTNGKKHTRKYVDNKKYNQDEIQRAIYISWRLMRKRCMTKNAPYSKFYYDKGIKVCDEWNDIQNGFYVFYDWAINNGYQLGLSIDRKDSSKNYCPENCRWITINENRRLGLKQPHLPKWEYMAYHKEDNVLLIFNKVHEFEKYTGYAEQRVSDGCKDNNYSYKGWKFARRSINTDYYKSQETIQNWSTLEDELPTEVRIIRLPTDTDKDIVHSA